MRGKALKDAVGGFITVNCRSNLLINTEVGFFLFFFVFFFVFYGT